MTVFDLLHENALADNALLRTNDANGDVFDIPRDVDFAFKTSDKIRAQDLCEYINGKNFGIARVDLKKDIDQVWVFVIIHMPINQHIVGCVSGFMVCLSRLFQVEFDGWGSVIQTRTSSETLAK
jgi:hypothetical protein